MRTNLGMPLGLADLLDRPVAQGEIDLESGGVRRFGRETGSGEEALGEPVVPEVLVQTALTAGRQPALAPEPKDQPVRLQRAQEGERGGGRHSEALGDPVEGDPRPLRPPARHEPQGIDLAPGEPLERLHERSRAGRYIW
jgi:hypothetical protein